VHATPGSVPGVVRAVAVVCDADAGGSWATTVRPLP